MIRTSQLFVLTLLAVPQLADLSFAQRRGGSPEQVREQMRERSRQFEQRGLADSFKGITTNGQVQSGLFEIQSTGVSTEPVRVAAEKFLASLTNEQRQKTVFPVDDPEWRKWMNQHFYISQGTSFEEMSEEQREAALELMRASLSARGLKLSRDIMRLNHTLGELNGDNWAEYGEWLYWITVMGEPSADEPWGWQIDGHHLIINYFVLGDQVVMTPLFIGSEPMWAESGKFAGLSIMEDELNKGMAMMHALTDKQRRQAIIETSKTGSNNLTEAFRDNVVLDYAGVKVSTFTDAQKQQLLDLVQQFVGNMREGHAKVRMEEVAEHLDETYFAWIGGYDDESVFYYRIHSPVILIEYDQQPPAGLRRLLGAEPTRQHVHAVVRTPNGNDYGKDLLRQHYEQHHDLAGEHDHDEDHPHDYAGDLGDHVD